VTWPVLLCGSGQLCRFLCEERRRRYSSVLCSFDRCICVILRMPSSDSVPSLLRTHLLRCASYSQRDPRDQVPGGQRHLPAVLPGEFHDAYLLEHFGGAVRTPVGAIVHVSVAACSCHALAVDVFSAACG
jgi:hypothetical protein